VIYLIVKITILISEPKAMDSWWMKKFVSKMFAEETFRNTSVVYEIVSHLPKLIFPIDNESYSSNSIDKYLDYASTIDTLLLIDKFRQVQNKQTNEPFDNYFFILGSSTSRTTDQTTTSKKIQERSAINRDARNSSIEC